jgi:hypothetical protein
MRRAARRLGKARLTAKARRTTKLANKVDTK